MAKRSQVADLSEALRTAGSAGLELPELCERLGQRPDECLSRLGDLEREGSVVEWSGRWYAVEATRWLVGEVRRRSRRETTIRVQDSGSGAPRGRGSRETTDYLVADRNRGGARSGDLVLFKPLRSKGRGRNEPLGAAVVKVLRRARTQLVGKLVADERKPRGWGVRSFAAEQALEARELSVRGAKGVAAESWVVLELGEGRRDGLIPATVTEVLGTVDEPGTDLEVVLRHYRLRDGFPDAVIDEVASLPSDPAPHDLRGRKDLRDALTVTIDGETARDFDDAIEVRPRGNGHLVRVHIADVSHYVRVGTELDDEARRRGTSVYFPERAVHMLPPQLSERLCSLRPGVARLTMTAELEFDGRGKRTSATFYRSVIQSDHRLTYRQVEQIYGGDGDDNGSDPESYDALDSGLLELLNEARELASRLQQRRTERGALDFVLPAVELKIDEAGSIVRVDPAERLFAHRVIEELMIAANEAVAEHVDRAGGHSDENAEAVTGRAEPAMIYRVHPAPRRTDIEALATICNLLGIDPPGLGDDDELGSLELARVLTEAREREGGAIVEQLALRAMSRAFYSPQCDGHFALAAPYYCHFTSPIRRYPDLVAHRRLGQLLARSGSDASAAQELDAEGLATWLSERERIAEAAERELRRWKKLRYLEEHVGSSWEGTISGVTEFGIFVVMEALDLDGLVSVDRLTDDYYDHDEEQALLRGRSSGRTFALGQSVEVVVTEVDSDRRRVDLAIAGMDDPSRQRAQRSGRGRGPGAGRERTRKARGGPPSRRRRRGGNRRR